MSAVAVVEEFAQDAATSLSPPENNAVAFPLHRERTKFSVLAEHDGFALVWRSARDGRVFKTLARGLTAGEATAELKNVGTAYPTRLKAALTPLTVEWSSCERVNVDSDALVSARKSRRNSVTKLKWAALPESAKTARRAKANARAKAKRAEKKKGRLK